MHYFCGRIPETDDSNNVMDMNVREVAELVQGSVITGSENGDNLVTRAFASDLMSDVLTIRSDQMVLLTGLVNIQAIRTAEMSDISCIVFVRNKKVTEEMVNLGRENQMTIIESPLSLFKASGLLYGAGIQPVF